MAILPEALSRETRSRWLEELLYTADLALVSESLDCWKGKLEVLKGTLELKGLKVNIKDTHRERAPSNNFPAQNETPYSSVNMDIWVVGSTSNKLFIRGS